MKVEILTPKKVELETEARAVILPTVMGEISVLNHHVPLIAVLKKGTIRVLGTNGDTPIEVDGGIAEIIANKITILLKKF
ncbi:MAG: F0F1 ATP synthase subunit epsilon [bacterium]